MLEEQIEETVRTRRTYGGRHNYEINNETQTPWMDWIGQVKKLERLIEDIIDFLA
jgi:hypothetical protein